MDAWAQKAPRCQRCHSCDCKAISGVQLAEVDEEVGELFLMEEGVDAATLQAAIRRATLGLSFVPVFLGSAYKNKVGNGAPSWSAATTCEATQSRCPLAAWTLQDSLALLDVPAALRTASAAAARFRH